MEEFGDMQTESANTRIPYASTLMIDEELNMIPAAGNPALPPQSTTGASVVPGLAAQFAGVSSTGYPVRGEKQW